MPASALLLNNCCNLQLRTDRIGRGRGKAEHAKQFVAERRRLHALQRWDSYFLRLVSRPDFGPSAVATIVHVVSWSPRAFCSQRCAGLEVNPPVLVMLGI